MIPRITRPCSRYEGAGVNDATRLQLFANWQGSITTIMKGDESGELVNINAYDAYGIANETNIGRFQYTGQIAIPELGLYHYKARVYSPTLGRFLQTDPIGYEDQVNLYAYVGNDPVNFIDPTGLCGLVVGEDGLTEVERTGNSDCDVPEPPLPDFGVPGLLTIYDGFGDWVNRRRNSEPTFLTDIDCSGEVGEALREYGAAAQDVGGTVAAAGGAVTLTGGAIAGGSGLLLNPGGVLLGGFIAGEGAYITAIGAGTLAAGSGIAFLGGESSRDVIRNGTDALINKLPGPGPLKAGAKKFFDLVADVTPDIRFCRK